ncbi:hypothetical protein LLE49_26280 [Alicyclobacillus tolerans]|uniref:hypothetical protein n=1 Tax=Alicyclobacillus tolerans TaxID=90970 RepID=UPI001F28D236|nr:hypothetical protein [Alicyclobacillus tolerans]MCF8568234.1 hypothetical protein [Alicyclobacillus tolerans]
MTKMVNSVTAQQVQNVLISANHHDNFFGMLLKAIGESALTIYEALNRDEEGNPREFDLSDFYKRYLEDVEGLLHDAQRIEKVQIIQSGLNEEMAEWVRKVVWPRLSEGEQQILAAHARTIVQEASPFPEKLYTAIRGIAGLIHPLLRDDVHEVKNHRITAQEVVSAVEREISTLKGVERLLVLKAVKDSLHLYEQLNRDDDGSQRTFSVVEWYRHYLAGEDDELFRDAAMVNHVAEAWEVKPGMSSGGTQVHVERHDMEERLRHVIHVWDERNEAERQKLALVAGSVYRDYGYDEASQRSFEYSKTLRVVRASVWPLVERELEKSLKNQ